MQENTSITFSTNHAKIVVGVLDIVHSTETTISLSADNIDAFYTIFLQEIAKVLHSHKAIPIKNMGDGILFYFPQTEALSADDLSEVVACGRALLSSRDAINAKFAEAGLPTISYRVSMSFGPVSAMLDDKKKVSDLFGATVTTCSKINKLALPNTFVAGEALETLLSSISVNAKKIDDYHVGNDVVFGVYQID
jgi:class 3 adenylate cyclase